MSILGSVVAEERNLNAVGGVEPFKGSTEFLEKEGASLRGDPSTSLRMT
jgi:hypothetical protein